MGGSLGQSSLGFQWRGMLGPNQEENSIAVTCELVQVTEPAWSLLMRWAIRKQIPHLRSLLRDGLSSLPWCLQRVSL